MLPVVAPEVELPPLAPLLVPPEVLPLPVPVVEPPLVVLAGAAPVELEEVPVVVPLVAEVESPPPPVVPTLSVEPSVLLDEPYAAWSWLVASLELSLVPQAESSRLLPTAKAQATRFRRLRALLGRRDVMAPLPGLGAGSGRSKQL